MFLVQLLPCANVLFSNFTPKKMLKFFSILEIVSTSLNVRLKSQTMLMLCWLAVLNKEDVRLMNERCNQLNAKQTDKTFACSITVLPVGCTVTIDNNLTKNALQQTYTTSGSYGPQTVNNTYKKCVLSVTVFPAVPTARTSPCETKYCNLIPVKYHYGMLICYRTSLWYCTLICSGHRLLYYMLRQHVRGLRSCTQTNNQNTPPSPW